jgi:hypothetical protein
MPRMLFQQFEIFPGEFLDVQRQGGEAAPKVWRCVMIQSSVDLPLL